MFAHFQEYHRNREKNKILDAFRGRCHKIADVCTGFLTMFQES